MVVRSYVQIFSACWVNTILYNYGATLELRNYEEGREVLKITHPLTMYQPQQALHDPSESTLYDSIWNQLDARKQRIKEEKSSKAKVEEVVDRVWTLS